ncbi:hypothetical protein AB1N83_011047 [Pleurotus pulmonarius]
MPCLLSCAKCRIPLSALSYKLSPISLRCYGFIPIHSRYIRHLPTIGTISVHALQLCIYTPLTFSLFTSPLPVASLLVFLSPS